MVTILEEIARDERKSPTARCTAIRALMRLDQDDAGDQPAIYMPNLKA